MADYKFILICCALMAGCVLSNPTLTFEQGDESQTLVLLKKYRELGAVLHFQEGSVNVEKVCPSGKKCPQNATCCKDGCCRHKNAVCCEESGKCCPEGTTCSDQGKACVKVEPQSDLLPWASETVSHPISSNGIVLQNERQSNPDNGCDDCEFLCCNILGIKFCCP